MTTTKLFQAVYCPFGEKPTKENTNSDLIIEKDIFSAIRKISESSLIDGLELISVTYFGEAIGFGSFVDFE